MSNANDPNIREFTVWAPRAMKAVVKVNGVAHSMEGPDRRGWWKACIKDVPAEADYTYQLNDDALDLPDPRSLWQPHGVHGASRIYDQSLFPWTDEDWEGRNFASAILYEMHVGTYSPEGTFDGAVAHLDHLCGLGVTHIEIMPVAAYPGDRGWGYDGVALFAVSDNYGGPDALKRFVDACHAKKLAVILDVVYNHFGPIGNYTGKFGPYVTDVHHTPWGAAVNFEGAGSDEVRRFFCDNAIMWLRDYHMDGLRLDAVHEFMDRSAVHFMEQLSAEIEVLGTTLGRKLALIAESDLNNPKIVTPREAGGFGMDAQWTDDFHHALFTLLYDDGEQKGYYNDFGTFDALVKSLRHIFVYDGQYSSFRNRRHGRPIHNLSAHHFIGFIQNHDQVGNRATGERLDQIAGFEMTKVAAGILLTAPFIPMLFMGEEYAASTPFLYFADHEDPEMAKAVSAGRKKEFADFGFDQAEIPDPEDRSTFENSKLVWDEVHTGSHQEMFQWYKKLIHLRRHSPYLNDGDLDHTSVEADGEHRTLCMRRGLLSVLVNLGELPAEFSQPDASLLLGSTDFVACAEGLVRLPPRSMAIVSTEAGG
jgi:maltooligosyltrehalose trehalohydrolase